ncbi:MAG: hypothetical protein N2556_05785 [Anaerolineae bacterium]|nr:hypothetical protein [Anaerolineae bacterium]
MSHKFVPVRALTPLPPSPARLRRRERGSIAGVLRRPPAAAKPLSPPPLAEEPEGVSPRWQGSRRGSLPSPAGRGAGGGLSPPPLAGELEGSLSPFRGREGASF